MLKKIMNGMNKPITWGGYFKFAGICTAISLVITAIEITVIFWDEVSRFLHNTKEKLNPCRLIKGLYYEEEEES